MKTIIFTLFLCFAYSASADNVLQVRGRYLTTPCGDTIVLHGLNKMCIYDANDFGMPIIPEIKKTEANVLRIVWDKSGSAENLDRVIQATIDNAMIPMVEMHDATGNWNEVDGVVDFWLSDDILSVVRKHSKYILVNIANEPGDYNITAVQFTDKMSKAIQRFRTSGIQAPLVLDATGYGQNIDILINNAWEITAADPLHNIMYSVHIYWDPKYYPNRETLLQQKLEYVANNNIPLLIGEFTGCYTDDPNSTDDIWKIIIEKCDQYKIGWLPWEWGPGNGIYEAGKEPILFPKMDITSDGKFASIKDGWAKEVVLTSRFSIRNTSVTPEYIIRKGECPASGVDGNIALNQIHVEPNPANTHIHIAGNLTNKIVVHTVQGQKVCELEAQSDGIIDCSQLANGIYYMTYFLDNQCMHTIISILR